jgi:hypothetical protein
METMGTVHRSRWLYQQAQSMLEKNLQMKRSLYGKDHPSQADTPRQPGIVYYDQGNPMLYIVVLLCASF